jgi:hypothetical protein
LSELPATAFTLAAATSTVVLTTAALILTVVATTVTAASATVTTAQPLQRVQIRAGKRQARIRFFWVEELVKCSYKMVTLKQTKACSTQNNFIVSVCFYYLG